MDQMNKREGMPASSNPQKNFARPKRMEWVRKTNRKLRLLRCAMAVIVGMLFVVGILLLVLPAFKVKEIVVEGDLVTTTKEEIIAASGIQEGMEIIGTDWKVAANNIEKQCPVRVTLTVSVNKVKIHVTELEKVQVKYGDYWVSLDADFKVMDISEDPSAFDGLLTLEMPQISGVRIGEPLDFANENLDLRYVKDVLEFVESEELSSRVDLIDVSDKFNVACVLDGCYRVVLGKTGDLESKIEIANEIIARKSGTDSCAVIDVSDLKKSIYRPVDVADLLLAN